MLSVYRALFKLPVRTGEFNYYPMFVCMCVCYKKGSVTLDPNKAKFTQKIDNCIGRVVNFIQP